MRHKRTLKAKGRHVLGPNVFDMFKRLQRKKDGDANGQSSASNKDASESDEEQTSDKAVFQYRWLEIWKWMRYDDEEDVVFCTSCEKYAISGNNPYTKGGCKNFKTSSFNEHGTSKTHLVAESRKTDAAKPQKLIVAAIQKVQETVDGAVLNLFRAAYTIASRSWSFTDFEHVIDLLEITGCPSLTKQLYHNDHACQDFICCVSESLNSDIIEKVKASPYFGLQVDESTDVATQQHIVLCISYLDDGGVQKRSFLNILRVTKADAGSLYVALVEYLQHFGFDMSKMVGFGSDAAATMIGHKTGVATRLKDKCPFLTSIHCVAHRANLAVVDAAKVIGVGWLSEREKLVNAIAAHFACSSQRLEKLQDLLEEYACGILRLERIQQTRWLSRHNAISKLCEDLDVVLKYAEIESYDIFTQLTNFSTIYLLHFLGDILGGLTILSKIFQQDYVDLTCVHEHVNIMNAAIQCYYLDEPVTDLNAFLEDGSGYPIIPEYGPPGGWLATLRASIRGDEYRCFKIQRDKGGSDLETAIEHQKLFARAICDCLNKRFEDTSILQHFSVLSPLNLPNATKARKFGENSLEQLIKFYGTTKYVASLQENVPPLVDGDMLRREYGDYKIHAAANWHNKDLEQTCLVIASNSSNRFRFKNILTLLQVALVQCASNAICERIFSSRTHIKDRWRARLGVESLNACLCITINGPKQAGDFDFTRSVQIWKQKAKRQIYIGESSKHLN